MRQRILGQFLLSVTLVTCAILASTVNAQAGFETFQLEDHPLTINHPVGNTEAWGLILGGSRPGGDIFDFQNVQMTINTDSTTPSGLFGGTMVHRPSGFAYEFTTTLNNLRPSFPGSGFTESVPYDGMFDDIKNAGFDSTLKLTWDSIRFEINLPEHHDFDNAYSGPLVWLGKQDGLGNPSYFAYRWRLDPALYPNPFYDVFGASAWLRPEEGSGSGDFHFIARQTTNPVPEPGTMALMAAGLAGMGFVRKRKQS